MCELSSGDYKICMGERLVPCTPAYMIYINHKYLIPKKYPAIWYIIYLKDISREPIYKMFMCSEIQLQNKLYNLILPPVNDHSKKSGSRSSQKSLWPHKTPCICCLLTEVCMLIGGDTWQTIYYDPILACRNCYKLSLTP